jgi:signal peptidase I
MARPARFRPDDDEEPDEDESDLDEEEEREEEEDERPRSRRHARRPPPRGRRHARRAPVRPWRPSATDEAEEEDEEGSVAPIDSRYSGKKPIYWRARDSLFFEPLVALAIVVVLLVSLFAYTQNWPPIYVVESNSMQHGAGDQLGLINAGDLVLAQKASLSSIVPYVVGLQTGYSTYGEYGDVLLYWPNGQGTTPVVHRAILYLQWDPKGFYNATDLRGLPCGTAPNAVYATGIAPGPIQSCNTTRLTGELDLFHVGWNSQNVTVNFGAPALGRHSGFLTMGDNNSLPDQSGTGTPAISELVEPAWVIGVARGMVPWFGAVKLLFQGQANVVPAQSWEYMGLTVVGLILVAFGVHYALRTEGIETPLRREEEEEAREAAGADTAPSWFRRFVSSRRHGDTDEEEDYEAESPHRRRTRPPPAREHSRRGRPVPRVRRSAHPKKKHGSDDEL